MRARVYEASFVFAHPDDETFGCGGTIALAAREGHKVFLITATRGEAGNVGKVGIDHARLGAVREAELLHAADILGIVSVRFFGFPDGKLNEMDPIGGEREMVRAIEEIHPDIVVTYGPDGITWHRDHITVGRWATAAFDIARAKNVLSPDARLYYCTLPRKFRLGDPSQKSSGASLSSRNEVSSVVDIRSVADIKQRASLQHKTQIEDMERARTEPRFLREEHFQRIVPLWIAGNPQENSLYQDIHQ